MPFRLPTRVTLEPGCVAGLEGIVRDRNAARVLLVCDAGLQSTPWPERIEGLLRAAGAEVTVFRDVEPNPRRQTTDALGRGAAEQKQQLVVGLGGGSVLDAAKAAAMLATNPGSCLDYEGPNRFDNDPLPFCAIPTTCGTGSEVTWVSVISDEQERRKLSVKGDGMFPDHALVDADLLATLPAHLVAHTGLDALTHAVEAYVGRPHNPVSDALAVASIRLTFRFLPDAHAAIASNAEARSAIARASTLAGIGFGNADVAGVHCLSESVGGMYDVPHGLANAILLAPVLRYQLEEARPRLQSLHEQVFGDDAADPAEAMIQRIEALVARVDTPGADALRLVANELDEVARLAEANGSNGSNPRTMTAADYRAILDGLRAS